MEFESTIKPKLKCIINKRKRILKTQIKIDSKQKCYYQLQFVEESRKCENPDNGCYPKCKIRLGRKRESQNSPKTSCSPQFCHSYLQKCHSGLQNYKNIVLVSKITKMPLWVENVGPMMWTCTLT